MSIGSEILAVLLVLVAVAALVLAFPPDQSRRTKRRLAAIKTTGGATGPANTAEMEKQRRALLQTTLKELEKEKADPKGRPSLRRRIEQAGLSITPRTYWIGSGGAAVVGALVAMLFAQSPLAWILAACGWGFGLPRWVLPVIKKRHQTAFTREVAR